MTVIDAREPQDCASSHIAGSLNVPLGRLSEASLPPGPLVLMRQGQIAAGSLVILSQAAAPAWIVLTWFGGGGGGFCRHQAIGWWSV